ncbi:heme A synthase [Massilia glaciei]|uniref:Heme A synthase n=2 Tax=Massilia glaciei TaxID=1524097 RepID=A0A2U2HK30_9BURK|nr:heme A synthase [Massilia glaciei]
MMLLAVKGLLVASVPLAMVYVSRDANKYRKLVWLTVFLTFDLILFGAFTRLTDSGLGCPDWPGCYGAANPFLAHADIKAAEALMPTGPVTVVKAWIEMLHRYFAMGIGCLCIAIMATAWIQWRKTRRAAFAPALPSALLLLVMVVGAFGAWTVTLKLQPVIVTIHLLLGMSLLSLLVWMGSRQDQLLKPAPDAVVVFGLRALALASAALLALQIALGGWVSTNYATLACLDFPLCGGKVVPEMDFAHGFTLWRELGMTAGGEYLPFSALTAIHWVHRNFAFVVIGVLGWTAWRARATPALRPVARYIGLVLAAQFASGVATVYLNFPLAIAVLHNAGAALLVLLVTMLNYKLRYMINPQAATLPAAAPGAPASSPILSARPHP